MTLSNTFVGARCARRLKGRIDDRRTDRAESDRYDAEREARWREDLDL